MYFTKGGERERDYILLFFANLPCDTTKVFFANLLCDPTILGFILSLRENSFYFFSLFYEYRESLKHN